MEIIEINNDVLPAVTSFAVMGCLLPIDIMTMLFSNSDIKKRATTTVVYQKPSILMILLAQKKKVCHHPN